jgi:acyl carrier protein
MINFIDLFNMVAHVAKPIHMSFTPASAMDQKMEDLWLDSLDGLVMMMYLCELYGIPDNDETKGWHPETVQEVYDLLTANKTKEPESLEKAKEQIK